MVIGYLVTGYWLIVVIDVCGTFYLVLVVLFVLIVVESMESVILSVARNLSSNCLRGCRIIGNLNSLKKNVGKEVLYQHGGLWVWE